MTKQYKSSQCCRNWGWAELEPGRDPSKGKKLPDPYGVLPLRDGQDLKQKMTLASHLKHEEGPVNFLFSKRESLGLRPGLRDAAVGGEGFLEEV